jgi:uncharacterized damage-inducible protein DinB
MTAQTLLHSLFRFKAAVDEELMAALTDIVATAPGENVQSALRVLHHAHLVDRIFAANLSSNPHGYAASWSKDAPLLADLASDTRAIDRWYLDYLSRIEPAELEETIDFIFTDGGHGRMSREEMLAHVITHGGYHRGEVGRLLPQLEDTAMRDVFAGYLHRSQPQRRQ